MGRDGISVVVVVLSTRLTVLWVAASWVSVHNQVREYMIAFLVLETMMVGIFCALDFVLFYVFFEGVLVPMFLIIGVWGGPRRVYAPFQFFLYTLPGPGARLLPVLPVLFHPRHHPLHVPLPLPFPPPPPELLLLAC